MCYPCVRVWRHASNWQRSGSTSLRNGVDSVFIFAAKTTNRPAPRHTVLPRAHLIPLTQGSLILLFERKDAPKWYIFGAKAVVQTTENVT